MCFYIPNSEPCLCTDRWLAQPCQNAKFYPSNNQNPEPIVMTCNLVYFVTDKPPRTCNDCAVLLKAEARAQAMREQYQRRRQRQPSCLSPMRGATIHGSKSPSTRPQRYSLTMPANVRKPPQKRNPSNNNHLEPHQRLRELQKMRAHQSVFAVRKTSEPNQDNKLSQLFSCDDTPSLKDTLNHFAVSSETVQLQPQPQLRQQQQPLDLQESNSSTIALVNEPGENIDPRVITKSDNILGPVDVNELLDHEEEKNEDSSSTPDAVEDEEGGEKSTQEQESEQANFMEPVSHEEATDLFDHFELPPLPFNIDELINKDFFATE